MVKRRQRNFFSFRGFTLVITEKQRKENLFIYFVVVVLSIEAFPLLENFDDLDSVANVD
jgi:hypothetical protein